MPKLTISKKDNVIGPSFDGNDYVYMLDGVEMTGLQSLGLIFEDGEPIACAIKFTPDDIEIDVDTLASLRAVVERKAEE